MKKYFLGNGNMKNWVVLDNHFVSKYKIQHNTNTINRAINKYNRVSKTMKKISQCHFK